MNIALIIAGGSGQRMNQDIPKQFLNVFDKPVIVYTLKGFQRHPEIDAIEVVCLEGWSEVLWAYARQFDISKLKWVVPGGKTAQESIHSGVLALKDICGPDDLVVIHDGIRPMVEEFVLTDVLRKCRSSWRTTARPPPNIFPETPSAGSPRPRHTVMKSCSGPTKRPLRRESASRPLPTRIP